MGFDKVLAIFEPATVPPSLQSDNNGHFIVHPSLDEPLVRELCLNCVGLRYTLRNVGFNMGQAPIITMTRTLGRLNNS